MTRPPFPAHGTPWEQLKSEMQNRRDQDAPWYGERMFLGGSYFGGRDVVEVANQAYRDYINYNALYGAKIFPSLVQYERDLIDALLALLNAPASASGSIATGGTESLMVAVKTAAAWARQHHPHIAAPELIVPHAAHPAFDKSAHLMGLKAVRLPTSTHCAADLDALQAALTERTIFLAASAPSYPYGVVDPIPQMAAIARRRNLWLHVDACHGGYVLPFARRLGHSMPDYDFAVSGVTSISVDVHKLGYANKGVSALLLADAELEQYQRYTFDNWPSGLYSTQNLAGSRSGGGLASAWAVLHYLGEEGYLQIASEILATRQRLLEGIETIDGLQILGQPHAYLVAFSAPELDIIALDEGMAERGWMASRLQDPPAIHLFLDRSHTASIDAYLDDLAQVVDQVKKGRRARGEGRAVYSR